MCNYKPVAAKNPPKTLCKNSPKIQQKTPKIWGKNLLHGQKLFQSFNKILAKNYKRYPKTS
jgi:hypothetical protein